MAKHAADEIIAFLQFDMNRDFDKLSFMGFSMGGILARGCLKYL